MKKECTKMRMNQLKKENMKMAQRQWKNLEIFFGRIHKIALYKNNLLNVSLWNEKLSDMNVEIFKFTDWILIFFFTIFFENVPKPHSEPENLKKSRLKKNSWNQINQKFFLWNCIFGSFKIFLVQKFIFGHFWNCKKWNLV